MPEFKDYTNDVEVIPKVPVIREGNLDIEFWKSRANLAKLQRWAEEGNSYAEIARKMGISSSLFARWRNNDFVINEAVELGREFVHAKVEAALFKKATGYMIQETVIDAKGNEHVVEKYIQPDIKAIQYYLNNRCKDSWSGNIQNQTNIQVPIIFGEDMIKK